MRRLLILVLIGGASLRAQSIKVAPSTHVATGSAEHPIVEPHLAVDPMHPDRLLTAAFARADPRLKFPEGQDNQICAAFQARVGRAMTSTSAGVLTPGSR